MTFPRNAMVLAAGLGRRMRASKTDPPKPLTRIAGVSLLDRMLARLADFGVERVVINLHHKPEMIEAHMRDADYPFDVVFSDERDRLMETGGGVCKAVAGLRPELGSAPLFVCNADVFWLDNNAEAAGSALEKLAESFDPDVMDACLLLAAKDQCIGHDGNGDFFRAENGLITRRGRAAAAPFVYAGVQILTPALFDRIPANLRDSPFSMNVLWDIALAGRKLFGCRLDGAWFHVGTPEGVRDAEKTLREKKS